MLRITKKYAEALVPNLKEIISSEKTGEVALISPEGCKLYRRDNGHLCVSGYADDGSDVKKALERVGFVKQPRKSKAPKAKAA